MAARPTVDARVEAGGATDQASGVWAPQRRRLTAGLVLTITLVAFESLAIATVMPRVEEDLGGLSLYGWVFSGFFLASLAGIVITGQLSDRRGPALPFAAGLVLFSIGLAAGGSAPSMAVLVAARLAQGFGAGAIPAAAYASVARGYPSETRARVFAVFSTAWVIPGIVGPSLATLVVHAASWRYVFLGLLPLVALAAAIAIPALRVLPPVVGAELDGADVDGAAVAHAEPAVAPLAEQEVAGAAVARDPVAGARDVAAPSASDGRQLVLVAGLIFGVGALLAAGTAPNPVAGVALVAAGLPLAACSFLRLVPAGTVRLRSGLPATIAVRGVLTWAFFGCDAYVSLAVTDGRGGSTFLAGVVLSVTAVTWTAGSWSADRWIPSRGPRTLDRIGFAFIGAGAAGMVAVALALPAWVAILAWSTAGFGMGLAYSPLSVTTLGLAQPGQEGVASSQLHLCDVLGVSIGTGIGGILLAFANGRGWSVEVGVALAFGVALAMALLGTLAARRLPTRLPTGPA
ncbi:MAG: arabinose efflux permease family protein [Acidimicrobiales bacterium]|nr:arabinose efflux permease family protein [Acidimicrobiales bacterium]